MILIMNEEKNKHIQERIHFSKQNQSYSPTYNIQKFGNGEWWEKKYLQEGQVKLSIGNSPWTIESDHKPQ